MLVELDCPDRVCGLSWLRGVSNPLLLAKYPYWVYGRREGSRFALVEELRDG